MFAGARGIGNLWTIVDVNRVQADGDLVLEVEPLAEKFRTFGWWAVDVDGHDIDALGAAFDRGAADAPDQPKCLVCHTRIGQGAASIAGEAAAHFMRVAPERWTQVLTEIEEMA